MQVLFCWRYVNIFLSDILFLFENFMYVNNNVIFYCKCLFEGMFDFSLLTV
jgi:hypothetical protein